jgi:hypothetical protein
LQLSSLELALVADFNLEMAAAYDEVAEDPTVRPKTRAAAREAAIGRRERAQLFQAEAHCLGRQPMSMPEQLTPTRPGHYAGPERRRQERRIRERRAGWRSPETFGRPDRRVNPDLRERGRRRTDS